MENTSRRNGFHTDMYRGALAKNKEINKDGDVKKDNAPATAKGPFVTDAFLEALKINEEMNRKAALKKSDVEPEEDVARQEEDKAA